MLSKHFKFWMLKESIDLEVLPRIQTGWPLKVGEGSQSDPSSMFHLTRLVTLQFRQTNLDHFQNLRQTFPAGFKQDLRSPHNNTGWLAMMMLLKRSTKTEIWAFYRQSRGIPSFCCLWFGLKASPTAVSVCGPLGRLLIRRFLGARLRPVPAAMRFCSVLRCILYTVPVFDFLPGSSASCSSKRRLSKIG